MDKPPATTCEITEMSSGVNACARLDVSLSTQMGPMGMTLFSCAKTSQFDDDKDYVCPVWSGLMSTFGAMGEISITG